jgi:centrin-1
MKKPTPVAAKPTDQKSKRQESKTFNVDDYVRWDLSREEVKEIKQAFDIFDNDGSGIMDPSELKDAFINLGFTGQGKFVYQILAELDEDQSGGI